MADEVVGDVRIDVHGNTDPLKQDIRRAAQEAGKALDEGIGQGVGGTAITDNIVDQISDAEQPSEREARKVGRAIVRGMTVHTDRLDLRDRIVTQLRDVDIPLRALGERIQQSLRESFAVSDGPLQATGERVRRALIEAMGGLSGAGSAVAREWDKRLSNIDARIAQAISEGPRRAAVMAVRDMGRAWDTTLTRVDDRIGRMSFQPFQDRIELFNQSWDQTLTKMDDRVGRFDPGAIFKKIGQSWDQTLTKMDDRVGRFDPLVTFKNIGLRWDQTLTKMDDRVGRFDPGAIFKKIGQSWDQTLTKMDDRVGRFDPAVTFKNALTKISAAAEGFDPPLTGVRAWREKFRQTLADDRGTVAIGGFAGSRVGDGMFTGILTRLRALRPQFGQVGAEVGASTADGMKKSLLQAGIEKAFMGIAGKAALFGPLIGLGVRAVAPLLVGLTGQISALGTALGGLGVVGAASFATMIPALGALKIAFTGMDKKATDALKEKMLGALGDLKGFKERVRNEIVPSLVDALEIVSKLAPEINKLGSSAAAAGGRIAKAFAQMLVGRKEELGNIFGNSSVVMERFGRVGTLAVDTFINALNALQPLVLKVTEAIETGMTKMFEGVNRSIDSGRFAHSTEIWLERGKDLLAVFKNLGLVITRFLGAGAESSGDFLKSFKKLTDQWAAWTASMEGKNSMRQMFAEAKPVVEEVWGLLGDIAGLFKESFTGDTGNLVDFVRIIRNDVIPGFERFQEMLRDSGIQDSLYDLGEALLGLFSASNMGTLKTFLDVLAGIVSIIAKLTEALGPLLVPLGTFMGAFKALQITKSAFGGLFSLPGMITGLVSPAKDATSAVSGLTDEAEDLSGATDKAGDSADKTTGKMNKMRAGIGKVAGAAEVAATAYVVLSGLASAVATKFDATATDLEKWAGSVTQSSSGMVSSMKDFQAEIPFLMKFSNFAMPWMDDVPDQVSALQLAIASLTAPGVKTAADWGFDIGGVEQARDTIKAGYDQIAVAAQNTGNVEMAQKNLDALTETLKNNGVAAEDYAQSLDAAQRAIDAVADAAGGVTRKAGGLNIFGDFTSVDAAKKSLDSIGTAFDQNIVHKIDMIKNNPRYLDAATGGLNPKGMTEMTELWKKANVDMINGVDNAIGETAAKQVRELLSRKSSWTAFGDLTQAAKEQLAGILPGAIAEQAPILEAQAKAAKARLDIILGRGKEPVSIRETARVGKKLLAEDVSEDLDTGKENRLFGSRLRRVAIRLQQENPDALPNEIRDMLKGEAFTIAVGIQTEQGVESLKNIFKDSRDWEIDLGMALDGGKFIEVEGQLMEMTADGTWKAVVDVGTRNAIKAAEDVYEVTVGPDGEPRVALIEVEDKGTADAKNDIDNAAEDRTSKITVTTFFAKQKGDIWNANLGAWVPGGPEADKSMVIGGESDPSIISPGGPTTMGFGDSFTPFASQRSGATGPGVVGSPNRWSDDDPKAIKNITINNYYPEPERTSDTIAMDLRVARYA